MVVPVVWGMIKGVGWNVNLKSEGGELDAGDDNESSRPFRFFRCVLCGA